MSGLGAVRHFRQSVERDDMGKKRIIGLILVAVSLIALIGIIAVQSFRKPLRPQNILASGAIGYWHAVDLRQAMKDLSQTQFVRALSQIDLEAAARQIGAKEEQLVMSRLLWAQISNETNQHLVAELLGNDLTLAVYPVRSLKGASSIQKMTDVVSNISLVTRLSPGVRFIELLTAAASRLSPSISETTQEYRGKMIHVIDIQGVFFNLAYVRIKDFLVIGLGDIAAKRAIDVVTGHSPALADDPGFLEARSAQIAQADQFGYFDYGKFIQLMESLLKIPENLQDQNPAQRRLSEGFQNAQGFHIFSCSLTYGSVLQGRCDFSFDKDRISDDVRRFYNFEPRPNETLSFVPKTAALYSWNAMISLDFYWEMLQRQLAQSRRAQSGPASSGLAAVLRADKIFGVETQSVIDLLADEFGFYLTEVKIGRIPVPQGVLFFKVKDAAGAKELLRQIFPEQGMLAFQHETYQDADIVFLSPFPFLADLEPAYCFFQGYLLLSPNRNVLKQSLDAARHPEGLWRGSIAVANDPDALTRPANGLFFVNTAHWAQEGKKILAWANEWAGIQDERRKAFEAGARKRLDDVKANLSQKAEELEQLEAQLMDEEQRRQSAEQDPEAIKEIQAQWEQKTALLGTVREAVNNLLEEQAQLEAAQSGQEEGQRLTDAGEARLAELIVQIPKRQERLAELEADVKLLEDQRSRLQDRRNTAEEISAAIKDQESRFEEIRREMTAMEETRAELEKVLAAYSRSNLPSSEQRRIALRAIVNPFLDSLEFMPWAAATTRMLPDRIRSEFFLEVR